MTSCRCVAAFLLIPCSLISKSCLCQIFTDLDKYLQDFSVVTESCVSLQLKFIR